MGTLLEIPADGSPAVVGIELAAGEVLQAAVRALDLDIVLELSSPEGERLLSVDERPSSEGIEDLLFVAEAAGSYRLQVTSRWGEAGSAELARLERRPASEEDRRRERAERDRREAERERRRPGSELEIVLERFRSARRDFEELGLPERAAATATREAIVLARLDRTSEAESLLEATLEAARSRGDELSQARALLSLANRAYGRGDLRRAVELAEQGRSVARRCGDPLVANKVELNLALFYAFTGEHRRAATLFRTVAEEAHRLGYLDGEATAYFNASLAHRGLRDYGAYFEDLRRADPLLERLGQAVDQGRMRMNEGIAYLDLGDPERAVERFRQALVVLPEREIVERARAQLNLGQAALELGDLTAARTRVTAAIGEIRGHQEPKLEGSALGVLAEIDLAEERVADALVHARESVEIARESGIERILPDSLVVVAEAARRIGDHEAAERALREALAVGRQQQDPKIEVATRLAMAQLRRDEGDPSSALAEAEAGIAAVEALRTLIPTLELRASLLARYRSLFDLAIELRYELQQVAPESGHAEAAFALAERARARSLLDALPTLAWRRDRESERLRDLGAALAEARSRHGRATTRGASGPELQEAQRKLDEALFTYERARKAWISDHPNEQGRLDRVPSEVPEIQRVLAPGEVYLQYHVGGSSAFVFTLTREAFEVAKLASTQELSEAAEALLPHLVRPSVRGAATYRESALDLAELAIPSTVIDGLAGARLLVAPDGPLVGIPFEALVLSRQGRRFEELDFLGREAIVSYLPSGAVGLELRRRVWGQSEGLVAFADPAPGAAREPVAALPGAREEATRLAALVLPSSLWLGVDASEARFRESARTPTQHLHFATHAMIDERRPELSTILLSPDAPDDGRLEGWEIASTPLSVDQVVLSACGSGLGRAVPGEGLVGLVQAFFEAGARSVVASNWPVVDRGTLELMVAYYRELQEADTATAWARARRSRIERGGLSAHPYYWASFVVFGWENPSPNSRR